MALFLQQQEYLSRGQPRRTARANLGRFPSIQFVFIGGRTEFVTPAGIALPNVTGLNGNPHSGKTTPKSGSVLATQFWPNAGGSNAVFRIESPTTSVRSVEWTYFAEYMQEDVGFYLRIGHYLWQTLNISSSWAQAYMTDSVPNDVAAQKNFSNSSLGVWHRAVARHKGSELKIFTEDGTATATTSGALYQPSNLYTYFVGENGRGYCSIAGGFKSALSDAECWALIDNPWQTLTGDAPRVLISLPGGGGASTLVPSLVNNSAIFFTPTVTPGTVTLSPSLFNDGDSFFAPAVTPSNTLSPALLSDADTFYAPTVTPGSVTLTPGLFIDSDTFYAATVSQTGGGDQSLSPSLLTDSDTFFSATVTPGSVALLPSLLDNANVFYAPTVSLSSSQSLFPALFQNTNNFYGPTVLAGITLTPADIAAIADAVWAHPKALTIGKFLALK